MDILNKIIYILKDAIELGLIWSIMALGIFISFRILNIADLTAEGSITLGSAISIHLIIDGLNSFLALLLAIIGGFIVGIITGLLHTKLKIPAILAGIISMTGLYSINLRVLGKAAIYLDKEKTIYTLFKTFINDNFLAKVLMSLIIVIIIFLILYYFFGTEIGMDLRAAGMNQKMAKSQGINTDLMIILGLGIANGLIALSGAMFSQAQRNANMDLGKGTIVIGLASIIIGEVLFGKRSFKNSLISVILGSIIFNAIIGIAIALGLNPNDLKLIQAIIITIILALPLIEKKIKRKNEFGSGENA